MKNFVQKHREILVYLVVGVMTTIFCYIILWLLTNVIFGAERVAANGFLNIFVQSVDWLTGVLFAYPLNRKWVFKSTNPNVFRELMGFAGSRVSTWILDALIMLLFASLFKPLKFIKWLLEALGQTVYGVEDSSRVVIDFWFIHMDTTLTNMNYWFVKIFISSVLVMIANYVFSKLLIFKKKKPADGEEGAADENV